MINRRILLTDPCGSFNLVSFVSRCQHISYINTTSSQEYWVEYSRPVSVSGLPRQKQPSLAQPNEGFSHKADSTTL